MRHLIRRLRLAPGSTNSFTAVDSKLNDFFSRAEYDPIQQLYRLQLHPEVNHLLPSIFKACSSSGQSLHFGLQLHCFVVKTRADEDPVVSNSIISMYGKLAYTKSAFQVFDEMFLRDTITWNSIINCFIRNGYWDKSLEMLTEMYAGGFLPKSELAASAVWVCGQTGAFGLARAIHGIAIVNEMKGEESLFLLTSLLDLYFKCNDLNMAFQVFDKMEARNEVSWSVMISGCTASQNFEMALGCLRAMQVEGIRPNRVTLVAALPVCAGLGAIKHGKEGHGYAIRHGFSTETRFSAALIDMYCTCRIALHLARAVFEGVTDKDVVLWSLMIKNYSRGGNDIEAMKLFTQMRVEGIDPNSITFLAIIPACTTLCSLKQGHAFALYSGFSSDIFVGNSLIDMYSKCGFLGEALRVFDEMLVRDSSTWSVLISAHGLHGHAKQALAYFHEMKEREMEPDAITLLVVLSACNHAGLVEEGQRIFHSLLRENKLSLAIEHYACYIDLLGRSGKLEEACEVVKTMPMNPSVKMLSSLASACRTHGNFGVAEELAYDLVKMEPRNASNYTLLRLIYAESSNWHGKEQVEKLIRAKNLRRSPGFSQIELEGESL